MKHHPKKSGIEGEAKNISPIDYLGKDFADPRMKPPRFKPKFEVIIASISASSISAGDSQLRASQPVTSFRGVVAFMAV